MPEHGEHLAHVSNLDYFSMMSRDLFTALPRQISKREGGGGGDAMQES